METQSPPKRMTRARAAARATESSSRKAAGTSAKATTTKTTATIAATAKSNTKTTAKTAAARMTTSTLTSTTTTATKRKTRADETDAEDEKDRTAAKVARPTRGRPRRTVEEAVSVSDSSAPAASSASAASAPPSAAAPATAAASEPAPVPRATRGRPKKTTVEPPQSARDASPKPNAAMTRGKTRKTATVAPSAPPEPVAKTTRARGAASHASGPPATKKSVTFEEPEKENVVPVTKSTTTTTKTTASSTGGTLRSRPLRKPATATSTSAAITPSTTSSARATRSRAASTSAPSSLLDAQEKIPLSPKKVTQMPVSSSRDSSEDELAASDRTMPQLRSILKAGTRPVRTRSGSKGGGPRKAAVSVAADRTAAAPTSTVIEKVIDEVVEGRTTEVDEGASDSEHPQAQSHSVSTEPVVVDATMPSIGSPAKRPPRSPSPYAEALKSPAKRVDGIHSSLTTSAAAGLCRPSASPFKASALLQTPAKRLASPLKPSSVFFGGGSGSDARDGLSASLLRSSSSLFGTPAKRPLSVIRPLLSVVMSADDDEDEDEDEDGNQDEVEADRARYTNKDVEEGVNDELAQEDAMVELVPAGVISPEDDAETESDKENEAHGEIIKGANEDVEMHEKPERVVQNESVERDEEQNDNKDGNENEDPNICNDDVDVLTIVEQTTDLVDVVAATSIAPDTVNEDQASILTFSGRLSSVLPRHADPVISEGIVILDDAERSTATSQMNAEEVNDEAPAQLEEEEREEEEEEEEERGEPMSVDENIETEQLDINPPARDAPPSGLFGLRRENLEPANDADSEDEDDGGLRPSPKTYGNDFFLGHVAQASPTLLESMRTPARLVGAGPARRQSGFGFTPLANQLRSWSAHSPDKRATTEGATAATVAAPATPATPATPAAGLAAVMSSPGHGGSLRLDPSLEAEMAAMVEAEMAAKYGDACGFDNLAVTAEDMDLAAEAREMSLLEPGKLERVVSANDDSVSDASQEYGDENQIPIDPAIFGSSDVRVTGVPETPQRVMVRSVSTTSKVPLKPAGEATPSPLKKRSATVSRAPPGRANAGTGTGRRNVNRNNNSNDETAAVAHFARTPSKSTRTSTVNAGATDGWSTVGSPARTPRRDLNPSLLHGAVVHVDVRTSEGADASGIFVDLLTQMGARCLKTWSWNPSTGGSTTATTTTDTARIGITHVVFKDGSARTLEKVGESGGVVQCVGVGWVLDCERDNEWLDEGAYRIDTSLAAPRRPARRRKSMEPKALTNRNGSIVSSASGRASARIDGQTAPSTPMNRRDSSVWVRRSSTGGSSRGGGGDGRNGNRSEHSDDDNDDDGSNNANDNDIDIDALDGENDPWADDFLMPVPATPAADAVARYAAQLGLATPSARIDDGTNNGGGSSRYRGAYDDDGIYGPGYDDDDGDGDDDVDGRQSHQHPATAVPKTCPPKRAGGLIDLGGRERSLGGGGGVVMRLMAARRKSLQFAPKVGSPLARAWRQ